MANPRRLTIGGFGPLQLFRGIMFTENLPKEAILTEKINSLLERIADLEKRVEKLEKKGKKEE